MDLAQLNDARGTVQSPPVTLRLSPVMLTLADEPRKTIARATSSGVGIIERWSSGPVRVGPPSAHEAPVPALDRSRGDQAVAAQRRRQAPDQSGEGGPVAQPRRGLGLVRRRTATSCRNTSSSTSFDEAARPVSRASPSTCWKIRYNSRSVTAAIMPDRWRAPINAGQQRVPCFRTPQDPGAGLQSDRARKPASGSPSFGNAHSRHAPPRHSMAISSRTWRCNGTARS